jgi:hypothetical protein
VKEISRKTKMDSSEVLNFVIYIVAYPWQPSKGMIACLLFRTITGQNYLILSVNPIKSYKSNRLTCLAIFITLFYCVNR